MISSIRNLNGAYQGYFMDHEDQVTLDLGKLEKYLVDNNCVFKGKSMPTLLKPNFISTRQFILLRNGVEMMSRALTKFIDLYLRDDQVRNIMGFSDKEDELFRIDPGYSNPLVISRLDAFLADYSIKFLEFNCDSPAGIAYADVLEDGFKMLFEGYPFLTQYRIDYARRQDILLASLLDSYAEFRSKKPHMPEKPVVAIVDWVDVSTYSEFELHQKHFQSRGIKTVIAAPGDFSIHNGIAMVRGQEIHLVYKRVITRELVSRFHEVETFVEAIKDGLICCCNSFRSFIVGNKKVLSVITDARFNSIFTREELQLIEETVPWTRILADAKETYAGREVELKSFIPRFKDQLVLKPSNMYGGKDVYIGRETPQSTWEMIMNKHLHDHSWVVQDFVDIPTEKFPEFSGSLRFKSKYVNINPFSLNGKYCGTITRVSDSQVINVSAGGGLVPTLTAIPEDTDPD